jgi:hypothetical protein
MRYPVFQILNFIRVFEPSWNVIIVIFYLFSVPVVGITAVVPQPMMRGIMSKMTPMEKQGANYQFKFNYNS